MILLCGIPSEAPLALVQAQLLRMGQPHVFFNQRDASLTDLSFELDANGCTGLLRNAQGEVRLQDVSAVYTRMMDEQLLPELRLEAPNSVARQRAQAATLGLTNWMEVASARVVNRASCMASNDSKPFQSQLIRSYGFSLPETLISNDAQEVLDFRAQHGRVIFKSISSCRSIVRELRDDDLPRLTQLRACPVQFQQRLEGRDVRVHVVGSEVFATAADSSAADYRYAAHDGAAARLSPFELDDELAQRCLRLSAGLGLLFSGIDLKLAPDGRAYCFEVNCCPGYSYFEGNTGQPISRALARLLAAP